MSEWRIVGEALALAPCAAAAVRLLNPSRLGRVAGALRPRITPTVSPPRIATLVDAATSMVSSSCLTKALVLHLILRRRGIGSKIVVGTATLDGSFRAHAWVESEGRTLLGGGQVTYAPLWRAG